MCIISPLYLVGALIVSGATSIYYRYTYLFEYTVLADKVRPQNRRTCLIPSSGTSSTEHKGHLNIGVIMIYESVDNATKAWTDELLQPLIANRASYCQQHNYTLLDANHLIDRSRPPSWSKLLAMEHYFKTNQYDYLFYLDMDAIIMNQDIQLETFIDASQRNYDILLTEDSNGMNSGVLLVRNSPWTLWFLRTAWEQSQLVPTTAVNGKAYPFRWEQRAFHYLTNSPLWQKAGLPTYTGNVTDIRGHVYMLPQCAFNSYILHPLDIHANRESAQYAPGDFLIHFAGKRGDSKKKLMKYYFSQLDQGVKNVTATGVGNRRSLRQ